MQIIGGVGIELSARASPELQSVDAAGGNSFEEYLKQLTAEAYELPEDGAAGRKPFREADGTGGALQTVSPFRKKSTQDSSIQKKTDNDVDSKKATPQHSDDSLIQDKQNAGKPRSRNADQKGDTPNAADREKRDPDKIPDREMVDFEGEPEKDAVYASALSAKPVLISSTKLDGGKTLHPDREMEIQKGGSVKGKPEVPADKESPLKETREVKSSFLGENHVASEPDHSLAGEVNTDYPDTSTIRTVAVQEVVPTENIKWPSVTTMEKSGSGKVQLQRENGKSSQSRGASRLAVTVDEMDGTAGKAPGVHEMEVDLSEDSLQDLLYKDRDDSVELSLSGDEAEREEISFFARMEQPSVLQSQRHIGSHQAAGTLAKRLNGDLGTSIVRQAKIMLSESDKAEIRLIIRPPELGRVRINLQMENGHIAGRILVDNGSVREVMEQNLPALQRAFAEAGLDVGSFEVSTGDSRQEAGTDDGRNKSNGNGRRPVEGAGAFAESIESIEVNEHGHRRINLVA